MADFKITIEDVSYTQDASLDGHQMSEDDLSAVNDEAAEAGLLDSGVVRILGAQVAEDEGQDGEDEHKVFVSIELQDALDHDDEFEAQESIEPPVDLLDLVAARPLPDDVDAAREQNWEAVSAELLSS